MKKPINPPKNFAYFVQKYFAFRNAQTLYGIEGHFTGQEFADFYDGVIDTLLIHTLLDNEIPKLFTRDKFTYTFVDEIKTMVDALASAWRIDLIRNVHGNHPQVDTKLRIISDYNFSFKKTPSFFEAIYIDMFYIFRNQVYQLLRVQPHSQGFVTIIFLKPSEKISSKIISREELESRTYFYTDIDAEKYLADFPGPPVLRAIKNMVPKSYVKYYEENKESFTAETELELDQEFIDFIESVSVREHISQNCVLAYMFLSVVAQEKGKEAGFNHGISVFDFESMTSRQVVRMIDKYDKIMIVNEKGNEIASLFSEATYHRLQKLTKYSLNVAADQN
jgi:hypothetical protein